MRPWYSMHGGRRSGSTRHTWFACSVSLFARGSIRAAMNLFGPRRSAWLSAPLAATLLLALLQPYSAGAAVMAGAAKRCPSHAGSVGHPPGRAPRIRSSLHACPDGTLRTATGRKIRIEGLDYLQSGWGNTFAGRCNGTATFPPRYAAADMARWGFNAV